MKDYVKKVCIYCRESVISEVPSMIGAVVGTIAAAVVVGVINKITDQYDDDDDYEEDDDDEDIPKKNVKLSTFPTKNGRIDPSKM